VYEIEVDDVGPSLRNASAKVNRAARSNGNGGGQGAQGGSGGGGRAAQAGSGEDTDPWSSDSGGSFSDDPPF
jgi:single-strand DNA-binding protein